MASTNEPIKSKCQSSTRPDGVGADETYSEIGLWLDRKNHPLLNDVVLSTVFEFLKGEDLKICRGVCKKWNVLTIPFIRSRFWVSIDANQPSDADTKGVSEFVEVIKQNRLGIPFAQYWLGNFCTPDGPGQEFLQLCGSTAKKVGLVERKGFVFKIENLAAILNSMPNIEGFSLPIRIDSSSGIAEKLFPDESSKPTLNKLKYLIVNDVDEVKSRHCPTLVEEIMTVAPNIFDIKVVDWRIKRKRKVYSSGIGPVLTSIETLGREPFIKNLELVNGRNVSVEALRRMREKGLKLKKLNFIRVNMVSLNGRSVENEDDNIQFMPQLTTLFKNSIEHLLVDEICKSFIQLPNMPLLKSLHLRVAEDFDSKAVKLNKLFPALKELILIEKHMFNNEWEEFLPNSEPCPNVKSLICHQISMTIRGFDHVLNVFPKLTKLELNNVGRDGGQIMKKIMSQMSGLEDLSMTAIIEDADNIDSLLTGIPVQRIQELDPVLSEFEKMTVELRAKTIRNYRTQYCQFPSIANLTNLKRLYLCTGLQSEDAAAEYKPLPLTDVFVYFGLYSMKHINKLEIEHCAFTKTGCEILTIDMELEAWIFRGRDGDIIPDRMYTPMRFI